MLAVIDQLSKREPGLQVWFVCDRGFATQAASVMQRSPVPVGMKTISAGKIRRYHGIPWWQQLADIPTTFKNIRDIFLLGIGLLQSLLFLTKIKPDAVFTKGGFVCVPVGLAAKLLGIPLVIHDSDAHPGLTNRLLARYAVAIATGAPLEHYSYPKAISHYVGIPVNTAYTPADGDERATLKHQLGYEADRPLLLVTGGGLGAQRVNDALVACAELLSKHTQIVHLTGVKNLDAVMKQTEGLPSYHAIAFVDEAMPKLVRAADVVVTRAGATTLLELAASAKPTIIVPNPHLTSGHQLKNAAVYAERNAAIIVDEAILKEHPETLAQEIIRLLEHPAECQALSSAIKTLARPRAAAEVAALIRDAAKKQQSRGV